MAKYKLVVTPESINEIQNAIDYYNEQQKGLGKIFYSEIKLQLNLITKNPFTRSIRYDDVRFALTHKFPYAIHYTIDETNKSITIQAILSDYQNPDTKWRKRQ